MEWTFAKFPKLAVTAHIYLENVKSHENVTRRWNTFGPSTIRCNAQICSRPKGQGWSARTGSVLKKYKIEVFGASYRKNFEILFRKNSWQHRFTFCVQISRKSAAEKWVKRCVRKMRFLSPSQYAQGHRHNITLSSWSTAVTWSINASKLGCRSWSPCRAVWRSVIRSQSVRRTWGGGGGGDGGRGRWW